MEPLIQSLIDNGYLKTKRIIKAFQEIKRKDFVPKGKINQAQGNYPVSIGQGQTISQPLTVAFMLEQLSPKKGDKILDVGSGSGWVSALLAYIVGKDGKVYALERIPQIKEFGKKNVSKYNFVKSGRVEFYLGDGYKGLKSKAPFDKIHVAAAASEIPSLLIKQLKTPGKIILPIKPEQALLLIEKTKKGMKKKKFSGFRFVPLIKTT